MRISITDNKEQILQHDFGAVNFALNKYTVFKTNDFNFET